MPEALQDIVRALSRPIERASHASEAQSSALRPLAEFVRHRVLEALSCHVFGPTVETDLLALRQLFADYDEALPVAERGHRLALARGILERLGEDSGDSGAAQGPQGEAGRRARAANLWDVPIRFAKGVGPKRAALMQRVGIYTVEDALWYLPRRYEDRSIVTPIAQLGPGARATIHGTVVGTKLRRTRHRGLTILEVDVSDDTGVMPCLYYNQPYLEEVLPKGSNIMASGVVSAGRRGWTDLRMDAPHYEIIDESPATPLHVGRIVPIYPETKGLTSRQLRTIVKGLLDEYGPGVEDLLPEEVLIRHGFPRLPTALSKVHFPPAGTPLASLDRGVTPAHQRLAFEEFFVLQLALAVRQRAVKDEVKGLRFDPATPLLARLRARLPFSLTPAQQRAFEEIARDMRATRPMNRLVQGDVGCGKTIVALHAMVIACGSGYQAALMAPTEILAEQHFLTLRKLLDEVGVRSVLLTSGSRQKARADALDAIRSGDAGVAIGTHALIQKEVQFCRLGLVVIDEQHKFGVLQRKTLLDKGYHPDVLVLTATPIPRTLAMTVYGDLDVTVIDALPPGRKPIQTMVFGQARRRKAYDLVREQVAAGRQAYIVYPLVEESEKSDLQAALQAADQLKTGEFRDVSLGVLHGRMKTEEKERLMRRFKEGQIQILVATTVVEVGVDVPNATVMVIEHAERFGLAQLHQLRGRVGRGDEQSYCLLVTTAQRWSGVSVGGPDRPTNPAARSHAGAAPSRQTGTARQRLEALVRSSDGFAIAEEDLTIRGPGEFFGTRQWGAPEFRAASLIRDGGLLERARQDAFALLEADPGLTAPAHRLLRETMLRRWRAKLELGEVG